MRHGTIQVPRRATGQPTGRPPRRRRGSEVALVLVDGYVPCAGGNCESMLTAQVYRGQIAKWVAARGWHMGQMFDESSLERALGRVESRETDGLVVVRVAHLGSSLREILGAIERVAAAQGRFVSIADGIDLSAPSGKLVLQILLSVGRPWS